MALHVLPEGNTMMQCDKLRILDYDLEKFGLKILLLRWQYRGLNYG